MKSRSPALSAVAPASSRVRDAAILAFALFFPSLLTWAYFVVGKRFDPGIVKAIYVVGKTAQFALPVLVSALVLKRRFLARRPNRRGLLIGGLFGLAIGAAIFFGGRYFIAEAAANPDGPFAPIFAQFRAEFLGRLESFDLATPGAFFVVLIFYSVFHSGLEEYYWRWFAFGRLSRTAPGSAESGSGRLAFVPAAILTNAAFTFHHILILGVYFGYRNALTWICVFGVFVGGLVWQAIYRRSDSVYGPWLSHGLIDAGIFAVGYALLF